MITRWIFHNFKVNSLCLIYILVESKVLNLLALLLVMRIFNKLTKKILKIYLMISWTVVKNCRWMEVWEVHVGKTEKVRNFFRWNICRVNIKAKVG